MHLQQFTNLWKTSLALLIAGSFVLVGCGQSGENSGNQAQSGDQRMEQMNQQNTPQTQQSQSQQQQQMRQQMQQQMRQQMQAPDIEVSDQELETFATVIEEAQQIQQGQQEKMKSAVEETGISLNRYSQIMRQMQSARRDTSQNVDMTNKEQQQIQEANQAVQQIQTKTQQQITEVIEEEGMEPQRFQKILQAVRTDSSLQNRFQEFHQSG